MSPDQSSFKYAKEEADVAAVDDYSIGIDW